MSAEHEGPSEGFPLYALELVALLRSGTEAAPRVLGFDPPAQSLSPRIESIELTPMAAPGRERALASENPDLGAAPGSYDYATIRAATLSAAAEPEKLAAELLSCCRCGLIVVPAAEAPAEPPALPEPVQALRLDWDEGPAHLLLLRGDRPAGGLDGALSREDDQSARRELAEARIRLLSRDLRTNFDRAVREWAHRTQLESELERLRGWPLSRRLYGSAVFNFRHRKVVQSSRPVTRTEEKPIFFLLGVGKSGTSWLMAALDEHPEVLCKGEGRFFGEAAPGRVEGRSLLESLLGSPELAGWAYRSVWTRSGRFDEQMEQLAGAGAAEIIRRRAEVEGKRIGGDKTPLYGDGDVLAQISRACPGARVIHIVRDGRDVAVSALHHIWNRADQTGRGMPADSAVKREGYRSGELDPAGGETIFPEGYLENSALGWSSVTGRAIKQGTELIGDRYLTVHYERMLDDPVAELTRAFGFLGAATDREVVGRCAERTSFERMSRRAGGNSARVRGEEDASSFFRKGIAGDWMNVFTAQDRETYKRVAGELLIELGYESDMDW